jgi:hypothetical protein
MLPVSLLRNRPSQRDALAEANGRRPAMDRTNALAQLGAVALCLVVLVTIAIRGC